jgi:uncharacterized protein
MNHVSRRQLLPMLVAVWGMATTSAPTGAAESPLDLTWKQLIPATAPPPKPKNLFGGAKPQTGDASAATGQHESAEGRWMTTPVPGGAGPAPIVTELDGKAVRIGGYIVPLDFNATLVKEFLLVPFVGACIHVPPPPANQIIYVKVEKGFEVGGTFDAVTVVGTLSAAQTFTGLAETGYSIDATSVETRTR